MNKKHYLWPIFFICHLGLALILSWHSLAKVGFAYSIAYEAFDIESHILQYAPENRYKRDFEYTTSQQHKEFFRAIGHSINHQGEGLRGIKYTTKTGESIKLLHRDEILHLLDVAQLINYFNYAAVVCLILLISVSAYIYFKKYTLPDLQNIGLGHLAGLLLLCCFVLIVGPTHVFYTLHEWIFPPDHPWFFYYQDSLMTTLMKAPDIFAFIGVLLITLASFFWVILLLAFKWILTKSTKRYKKA